MQSIKLCDVQNLQDGHDDKNLFSGKFDGGQSSHRGQLLNYLNLLIFRNYPKTLLCV